MGAGLSYLHSDADWRNTFFRKDMPFETDTIYKADALAVVFAAQDGNWRVLFAVHRDNCRNDSWEL